ncbi:hypothetical protein RBSH_04162 [Rhodopirellula baltica SH28]|uniref:Uncharacterized protein n=2 Tax=Rhodopirellula baltica TaxID=265606 RepID=Q7UGK1_RHOBA|nr:hypothetical protein RBSH_04162 [Rhodopirellula baltica SH28]CAD78328.1 hypothetical protein RB5173 [Rhodopirellula baltica SH 1]
MPGRVELFIHLRENSSMNSRRSVRRLSGGLGGDSLGANLPWHQS